MLVFDRSRQYLQKGWARQVQGRRRDAETCQLNDRIQIQMLGMI